MNKKDLTERDICSKFIGPAIKRAGWDGMLQIREEVAFTKGRIIVRGKLVSRGKAKRADYILYYKPNIPIAIIEAKDNNHSVGDGMQQALDYATTLNIPFVFSSNGDGFVFHDRTGISPEKEASLTLDEFPSPEARADLRAIDRETCGSPKSKTPPLSTGDPCNYQSALSIHSWAESREVSASDWAGRNQIGDAVSPGLRRKLDREGDSWPVTISGGE
jgi:type I site-specific restriction endonuclease